MATPDLPDELVEEAARLFTEHRSKTVAANFATRLDGREGGISRAAFSHRVGLAAKRGLLGTRPVLPGFSIKKTSTLTGPDGDVQREWVEQGPEAGEKFVVPDGMSYKGLTALTDREGRVVLTYHKLREDLSPEDIVEVIKRGFDDYESGDVLRQAPTDSNPDLLTLYPANDWHIGLYAWHRETEANWDLDTAERVLGEALSGLVASAPNAEQAILLGGGDLLHSDTNENKTARSGNNLDVDGRHAKVLQVACRLMVRFADMLRQKHPRVLIRILKGNHDEYSAIAVAYFLLAWYRNDERVTVDVDPSLFFWFRFGKVLLGATHGHTVKIKDMPNIMAHRRAEDWGQSTFRFCHGFHRHHTEKVATEGNGVISEIHQAPIPADAWHFNSGYLSGRSLQAISYHKDFGEVSRNRMAVML